MSGGSYDYNYNILLDWYVSKTHDKELDEMVNDLAEVLHDLEWWQSCDYSEEDYRKTLMKFKKKWMK